MGAQQSRGNHLLSVIVPFHRNGAQLEHCLIALGASAHQVSDAVEIMVVADGAVDACADIAARHEARLVSIPGPRGPAVARNQGAQAARGEILVFVDSDVAVHAATLSRVKAAFDADAQLAAVFGAYDDAPADPGFVSQAKNLGHAFIHRQADRAPTTFWAGLGAIRAEVLRAIGGFNEAFSRPSVEDIELGYRLTQRGYRMRLDPDICGTHLKRWSALGALVSDVRDRGIPWTRLLYRYGGLRNDLNLTWSGRACIVLAWAAAVSLVLSWKYPALLAAVVGWLALMWGLQRPFYAWLAQQRGRAFAARWFPLHVLHHALNGVSFGIGTMMYLISPRFPGDPTGPADRSSSWRP
jgi:GT2 family glycosyltransferase